MGGCRKNGAVVVLEDFQPCRDIGGIVLPRFLVQFEVGAQESRSKFRNEFLAAVTFVAPALATEITIKALRVLCPVRQFMGEGGVVALSIAEGFEGRHLHVVEFLRIVGAVSAVFDRGGHAGEKLLCMINAGHRIKRRCGFRVVDFWQPFDLLDVENGIAFHVRDFEFDILAGLVVALGASDGIGIDHKRAFLALADVGV